MPGRILPKGATNRRSLHPFPTRRLPAAGLLVLLVLLVLALLAVPAPWPVAAGLEDHEAGARHVLVLIGEDGMSATVFQRIHLEPIDENRTISVAVPTGGQHEVRDDQDRILSWNQGAPGILHVAVPTGTGAIETTSRNIETSGGQTIRFGARDPANPLWLAIGVPPSLDATAFGLPRIPQDELQASPAIPPEWPLPADWDYAWNEGEDDTLPDRIASPPGSLRPTVSPLALGAGLAVLLALFTLWLVGRIHKSIDDPTRTKKQPVMKHLEELRKRLVIVSLVLFIATAFFFSFGFRWTPVAGTSLPLPNPTIHDNAASQVFTWLSAQIVPSGVQVVVVAPFDAVVTLLLLAFALGVLVTFPVLAYHTYAFLAPALYPHERRLVLVASPAVIGLLLVGAAFGLLLMAPLIVNVLYGFATASGATAFVTMPQLVSVAALLSLLFAVAFQLPLVMMLTARMGLVRAATYRRQWRWAVILIIIVAALVTDPTVITQLIVAAALLGLYGIGLVLATIADKKRSPTPQQTPQIPSTPRNP